MSDKDLKFIAGILVSLILGLWLVNQIYELARNIGAIR